MSFNREIELKLRFTQEIFWDDLKKKIGRHFEIVSKTEQSLQLESFYYDTPEKDLRERGISYRIRHQKSELIATIKADGEIEGGLHSRNEWSANIEQNKPDLTPFIELLEKRGINHLQIQDNLLPIFNTSFFRNEVQLCAGENSIVELALDKGSIVNQNKELPINELELELKKGEVASVFDIAAKLIEYYPLVPESHSKYSRGLLLDKKNAARIPAQDQRLTTNTDEDAPKSYYMIFEKALRVAAEAQERLLSEGYTFENFFALRDALQKIVSILSFGETYHIWSVDEELTQSYNKTTVSIRGIRDLEDETSQQEMMELVSSGRYMSALYRLWACLLREKAKSDKSLDLAVGEWIERTGKELYAMDIRNIFTEEIAKDEFLEKMENTLNIALCVKGYLYKEIEGWMAEGTAVRDVLLSYWLKSDKKNNDETAILTKIVFDKLWRSFIKKTERMMLL